MTDNVKHISIMHTGPMEGGPGKVFIIHKGVEIREALKGGVPAFFWWHVNGNCFDVRNVGVELAWCTPSDEELKAAMIEGINRGMIHN